MFPEGKVYKEGRSASEQSPPQKFNGNQQSKKQKLKILLPTYLTSEVD